MTQHVSLEEATSGDCVPEVAQSEAPPQHELGERASLASRISEEVLTATRVPSHRTIQPVESPPGWLSVESALRSSLDRCDHLLRRGAVHSSRQEALMSLRHLFRAMDLHKRTWEREPAGQQALVALKEAEDFERSLITEPTLVHRLVQSHQTPILQETPLDSVSPAIAAQHYRSFARAAFLDAADGHAWAADLLFALGKTYEKEAQQQPDRQLTLLQHATVCYQSAHKVDPRRHDIANQLGFNLLELDRVDEAVAALNAAIVSQPSANAYRNLAEAYRRQGRVAQMHQAQAMASSLASHETHYSTERPEITEISPEEFARISPPPAARESQQAPSKVSSRPLFSPKLR
jgi:tetratricopeptide (TPR) repeat protein